MKKLRIQEFEIFLNINKLEKLPLSPSHSTTLKTMHLPNFEFTYIKINYLRNMKDVHNFCS